VGLRRRHDAADARRAPPDELVQLLPETARGRW
jgi:hypothetical protein